MDETFSFFHSWPSALKYMKHFTLINTVINYVYPRTFPIQKHFFLFFNFVGRNLLTNSMHSMRIKPRIGSAMFVKVVKNIIPPMTGIT